MEINKKITICSLAAVSIIAAAVIAWRGGILDSYRSPYPFNEGQNKHEQKSDVQKTGEPNLVQANYSSNGNSLLVTFNNTNHTVTLNNPQTGTITLPQAISASGARYADSDENIVFWEHQGEGILTVNNQEIFRGKISSDIKNIDYIIGGETFSLINGVSEKKYEPEGSSSNILRIFGEPIYGDLNNDGDGEDAALWLENETGGSGTFYYAVLAMHSSGGYLPSNTLLLGDRIAPQTIEIKDGQAIFNFADRKSGEPMSTPPSYGQSVSLDYDANSNTISKSSEENKKDYKNANSDITAKEWRWIESLYNNDKTAKPRAEKNFSLKFDGKKVAIKTDCNNMSGNYIIGADNHLDIKDLISTKMYCEGSQENEFAQMLKEVSGYTFDQQGKLILLFKFDTGSMIFE